LVGDAGNLAFQIGKDLIDTFLVRKLIERKLGYSVGKDFSGVMSDSNRAKAIVQAVTLSLNVKGTERTTPLVELDKAA
jgi:hypothetical protein